MIEVLFSLLHNPELLVKHLALSLQAQRDGLWNWRAAADLLAQEQSNGVLRKLEKVNSFVVHQLPNVAFLHHQDIEPLHLLEHNLRLQFVFVSTRKSSVSSLVLGHSTWRDHPRVEVFHLFLFLGCCHWAFLHDGELRQISF